MTNCFTGAVPAFSRSASCREKARKARKPVYDNAKAENPGNVNSWKPRNALSGKLVTDNDETGKLADGYIAEMMKYLKDRDR